MECIKKRFIFYVSVDMTQMCQICRGQKRLLKSLEVEWQGFGEPPHVGTGNCTLAPLATKQVISLAPHWTLYLFKKCAKIYWLGISNLKTFKLFPVFVFKSKNAVAKTMWKELLRPPVLGLNEKFH